MDLQQEVVSAYLRSEHTYTKNSHPNHEKLRPKNSWQAHLIRKAYWSPLSEWTKTHNT